ncbi:hypothetical protein [Phenylobacterium sp.]|uniref:hypothetical protein n=1 Tax=Phenylobacterium sp. TaxID=1871053 RepID=UPI003562F21B
MIVQLSPDTPLLIRAVAGTALVLHIGGASLGMVSGAVALIAPKGQRLHRVSGHVFFVAMLTMSAVAAVVAPILPDRISAVMGLFTFYLTATAWAVVRRPASQVGRFETWAGFAALGIAALFLALAWIGGRMPKGLLDGEPSQLGYIAAVIALLAAAADFRMIRRGGLAGPPRIARHLWRMCLALFIAWGSAAGQPKVVALLPEALHHQPLLIFMPALTVLALMVFWLIRIRVPKRRGRGVAVLSAQEALT